MPARSNSLVALTRAVMAIRQTAPPGWILDPGFCMLAGAPPNNLELLLQKGPVRRRQVTSCPGQGRDTGGLVDRLVGKPSLESGRPSTRDKRREHRGRARTAAAGPRLGQVEQAASFPDLPWKGQQTPRGLARLERDDEPGRVCEAKTQTRPSSAIQVTVRPVRRGATRRREEEWESRLPAPFGSAGHGKPKTGAKPTSPFIEHGPSIALGAA